MNSPITPEAFARLLKDTNDEQLAAGLAANRELILTELFRQMPDTLDAAAVGPLRATVHWRISGRPDGGHDTWQVTIADGGAQVERDGSAQPDVVYTIDAIDFLKLAGGLFEGPELFLWGRIVIEGDLVLAAQMPALFKRPRPADAGSA